MWDQDHSGCEAPSSLVPYETVHAKALLRQLELAQPVMEDVASPHASHAEYGR